MACSADDEPPGPWLSGPPANCRAPTPGSPSRWRNFPFCGRGIGGTLADVLLKCTTPVRRGSGDASLRSRHGRRRPHRRRDRSRVSRRVRHPPPPCRTQLRAGARHQRVQLRSALGAVSILVPVADLAGSVRRVPGPGMGRAHARRHTALHRGGASRRPGCSDLDGGRTRRREAIARMGRRRGDHGQAGCDGASGPVLNVVRDV